LSAPAAAQQDEGDHALRHACLLALLAALALGVAVVPRATAREQAAVHAAAADRVRLTRVLTGIAARRDETWRWQRLMYRPRTPFSGTAQPVGGLAYKRWVLDLWRRRAVAARRQALNPPHRRQWLCIHRYEGSWDDPRAPYYGGLQMDREFQSTYGPDLLRRKGTADHWTPLEQMWVAERAYRTRGFWPWPNTARYCGLL
jgi:hypothetical protein